nr:M23 family metallopeptidase [Solirubrobacterales bacterium]
RVKAGEQLRDKQTQCAVGSTGRSSTSHLHFEIWPNGWRTGAKNSVPVDPLAQLKAWDR